jgi:hypothetical protein
MEKRWLPGSYQDNGKDFEWFDKSESIQFRARVRSYLYRLTLLKTESCLEFDHTWMLEM